MPALSVTSPSKSTSKESVLSPSKVITKSTPSPSRANARSVPSPTKTGLKRKFSHLNSSSCSSRKRRRQTEITAGTIQLQRPKKPVAEPWPRNELKVFDCPGEEEHEWNFGVMLRDVLKSRGWRYSTKPCHGTYDEDKAAATYHVREFEASLLGQKPEEVFGKRGATEDGYRLQALPLPKHALWMMGRLCFRVPGTAQESARYREDFVNLVVKHGDKLPGKSGNYRIAKFPGTETLCWKTNLTEAFNDKPWYPATYILPRDKASFLKELRARGDAKNNLWIGKPRNDYGGTGIRVWKGTDPDIIKMVQDSDNSPRSIVQSYIPDPLLISGYKFHMRIHLAITNLCPLEAYVQENGQCLFATKPYTLASSTLGEFFDPPCHVTNMGLNAKPENKENYFKKKPIIGKGQQIRMSQLVSHLAETNPSFNKRMMWQQVLDIAADTTHYFAKGIRRYGKIVRDRHFELFGMDLMLDKDLKVWMCEVNTDPGLSYPDKEVLGSPNPDYHKECRACEETLHDWFALLGLDATRKQTQGSLRHWMKVDFSDPKYSNGSRS